MYKDNPNARGAKYQVIKDEYANTKYMENLDRVLNSGDGSLAEVYEILSDTAGLLEVVTGMPIQGPLKIIKNVSDSILHLYNVIYRWFVNSKENGALEDGDVRATTYETWFWNVPYTGTLTSNNTATPESYKIVGIFNVDDSEMLRTLTTQDLDCTRE